MARSHILIFLYNRQKNKYIIYTAESCLPYKAKAITSHQLLKIKTRCFVISILSARCFINSRATFKEKEGSRTEERTMQQKAILRFCAILNLLQQLQSWFSSLFAERGVCDQTKVAVCIAVK